MSYIELQGTSFYGTNDHTCPSCGALNEPKEPTDFYLRCHKCGEVLVYGHRQGEFCQTGARWHIASRLFSDQAVAGIVKMLDERGA